MDADGSLSSSNVVTYPEKHGSDSQAYKILDSQKGTLQPRPFPIASEAEPRLTLADVLGKKGSDIESAITRTLDNRQMPFVFAGNGGHALQCLTSKAMPTLRTPMVQASLSNGDDQIVFENYDDSEYGYLRIIADQRPLRIEYHPAPDGDAAKTSDDSVTIDLATRKIVAYNVPDATKSS
jgi:hypothetical protein